jgi:hypothetical protein
VTRATVDRVDAEHVDDGAPPSGTAIVRPLRHVRAVRERYSRRFADPAEAATSRSARAWAWALGESETAPVTDRMTAVPPSRPDIEAEITAADQRRLRGGQENRADAAATILQWLIGDDDHVPVRGENRGALVGGFGDVVRSREQITNLLALAAERQQRVAAQGQDIDACANDRALARQDADYLGGVMAALTWILGERAESPITRAHSRQLTTRDLKMERVHAEDVIEQSRYPWMADRLPLLWYGEGVKFTITWLLGDSTAAPVDPAGRGPYGRDGELSAIFREAQRRQRQL